MLCITLTVVPLTESLSCCLQTTKRLNGKPENFLTLWSVWSSCALYSIFQQFANFRKKNWVSCLGTHFPYSL